MANTLVSLKKKKKKKNKKKRKENNPKGKCLQYNGLGFLIQKNSSSTAHSVQ